MEWGRGEVRSWIWGVRERSGRVVCWVALGPVWHRWDGRVSWSKSVGCTIVAIYPPTLIGQMVRHILTSFFSGTKHMAMLRVMNDGNPCHPIEHGTFTRLW